MNVFLFLTNFLNNAVLYHLFLLLLKYIDYYLQIHAYKNTNIHRYTHISLYKNAKIILKANTTKGSLKNMKFNNKVKK